MRKDNANPTEANDKSDIQNVNTADASSNKGDENASSNETDDEKKEQENIDPETTGVKNSNIPTCALIDNTQLQAQSGPRAKFVLGGPNTQTTFRFKSESVGNTCVVKQGDRTLRELTSCSDEFQLLGRELGVGQSTLSLVVDAGTQNSITCSLPLTVTAPGPCKVERKQDQVLVRENYFYNEKLLLEKKEYSFDGQNRMAINYHYDENDRVIKYSYLPSMTERLVSHSPDNKVVTVSYLANEEMRSNVYTYDDSSRILQVDYHSSDTPKIFSYEGEGKFKRIGMPYQYTDKLDMLPDSMLTDDDSEVSLFTYDDIGNILTATSKDETHVDTYSYEGCF